jgi:hypothetical protein
MPPTPDVRPTSHDRHDPLLVAALAAGDLAATDRVRATELIETCPDCAALHDDLLAIARATASVPPPISARPRDFRLSREQAARLRPSGWRRFIGAFGSPRFAFTKPLGVGLATIGLAGLLLGNVSLGSLGGMSAAAPMSAPAASAGSAESNQSGATRGIGDAAASAAPASAPAALGPVVASPAASGTGGFYPVSLPSPSSAPAPSMTTDRSAYSANDHGPSASPVEAAGGPKTTTPGASQPTRDILSATGQPLEQTADDGTAPDLRTMIFVAAVLVGLGLLVLRRVARGVTAV